MNAQMNWMPRPPPGGTASTSAMPRSSSGTGGWQQPPVHADVACPLSWFMSASQLRDPQVPCAVAQALPGQRAAGSGSGRHHPRGAATTAAWESPTQLCNTLLSIHCSVINDSDCGVSVHGSSASTGRVRRRQHSVPTVGGVRPRDGHLCMRLQCCSRRPCQVRLRISSPAPTHGVCIMLSLNTARSSRRAFCRHAPDGHISHRAGATASIRQAASTHSWRT